MLAGSWAIGQFFLAPLIYMESSWRIVFSGIIGAPFLINLFFIHSNLLETPRYLASKGRYPEARIVLDFIANTNRRPKIQCKLRGEISEQATKGKYLKKDEEYNYQLAQSLNYFDLFKFPSLKKTSLMLLAIWVFRYVAYYGINFSLTSFGGEIFTNFTLVAFAELIACLVACKIFNM